MILRTPTSRFICFSLTLLLLLQIFTAIRAADLTDREIDDEDLEGLDELLALDEEEETQAHDGTNVRSSEAEILAKAQRIVLELSSENAMRVIDQNEYVLVLGYAPWCARSAELMPQFAEAATLLKDLRSPVLMAKLDAERYPKAASALEIKGFPTVLFFVNGTSQPYSGGFSSEEIVIWARKKTGVPVIRISSVSEAEGFLEKHHIFVVGLFEKFEGFDYEEFRKAAAANNDLQFVEVSDIEVAKLLAPDITPSNKFLAIVKNEPEKLTKYEGTFEMQAILQFLEVNKFPLVTKLTEMNSVKVYSSSNKLQVILFAEEDELKNHLEPLQNIARKFKSKLMFIYVDINDENLAKPFLSLFGLEDSDETLMAAFDNGMSSKFLLDSDLTERNIEDFCHGFLHGKLSPFYKSQPIPDNLELSNDQNPSPISRNMEREASVFRVVGKTFDDLVLRSPKNVVLEVYTPWCINCEKTSKHVEKLAKHFRDLDNLVFSKIDASANEHPKLQVNDYPTLLFYPVDDKENPIKLSTKSSLKELAASINTHLRSEKHPEKDEL